MTRFPFRLAAALLSATALATVLALTPGRGAAESIPEPRPGTEAVSSAAVAFLASLDDAGRARATFRFEDEERFRWFYVPRERTGLPLADMTLAQRSATHHLLRSVLSARGYLKVTHIMHLEEVLNVLENGDPRRNPEHYYVSIFGSPGESDPWGLRVEGHHLSLHFTVAADRISVTPAFLGANPAEVRTGPYAGLRVLAAEEDLARDLLASLTDGQRSRAVLPGDAPGDILTRNDVEARRPSPEGLPASAMRPDQQARLWRLIEEIAGTMTDEVASEQLEKVRRRGVDSLRFAWAGSAERGKPHYYRIHGPALLIEYDNTQNDANHIHSVWRDLDNDFGRDLLRLHYQTAPEDHGH